MNQYFTSFRTMLLLLILLALTFGSVMLGSAVPIAQASGTITGTVFRDFNANGSIDGVGESGVAGISVTAYDSSNTPQGTAPTAADGTYSLGATGTGPYRIEFTSLPTGYYPSPQGTDSGSSVQFVPDGSSSNINLGIHYPAEYCQDNPNLCTNVYIPGGQAGNERVLAQMPYLSSGDIQATAISRGNANQVGTTWGLAYQPSTQAIFSAAFMKRHAGFGPGGTGQIYRTDAAGVVTPFALIPNTGVDPHPTSQTIDGLGQCHSVAGPDYAPLGVVGTLIGPIGCYFHDPYSFDKVATIGLGDMDINVDSSNSANDRLFVVNLNDRQLYQVTNLAGAPIVSAAPMPLALTGAAQGCALADVRPFGLTFWRGVGYAGLVCSAETTQNAAQLRAYIYSFDPATMAFGSAPLVEFPLTYTRGFADAPLSANWHPWISTLASVPASQKNNNESAYAQPILSGLVFDNAGNLTIGLRDRYGDQMGNLSGSTDPSDQTMYVGISAGDTLKVCLLAGAYQLESNGICGGDTSVGNLGAPGPDSIQSLPQGPSGNEFYAADALMDVGGFLILDHEELSLGGLAYLPGLNEVATTAFDPINGPPGYTGGVRRFQATDAHQSGVFQLYKGQFPDYFGKAAGMGDLELLCDSAPIEIGNRVWNDANHNGIQDAGELPIAGVVLGLYTNTGMLIDTVMTDSNGNYIFSSASGTDVTGRNYGLNIQPSTVYTVAVLSSNTIAGGALTGLVPTTANSSGNITNQDVVGLTPDITDSDGVTVAVGSGANAATIGQTFTTGGAGANNHSFDFGFSSSVAIGNQVWYDTDNNGMINGSEVGVDGVKVELFLDADNNGTLTGAEQTPVSVQNTTSGGYYLFTQVTDATGTGSGVALASGHYLVGIPAVNFASSGVLVGSRSSDTSINGVGAISDSTVASATDTNVDDADDGVSQTTGFYNGGVLSGPLVVMVGDEPGGTTPGHFNTVDGTAGGLAIPNANVNRTVDFGFYRQTLGNLVFHDINNNGIYDSATDAPLLGATVKLFAADGTTEILVGPDGILGTADDTAGDVVTGATGVYLFQNLPQGDYRVQVTPPTGYTSSTDIGTSASPNANTDNDDNGIGAATGAVISAAVTLTPGSTGASFPNNLVTPATGTTANPTLDFGFYRLSLGNLVWNDLNNNGKKDASESGIDSVLVNLYQDINSNGTLDVGDTLITSQTTSNGGHYLFTGLAPATYFVQLAPSNFAAGGTLVAYISSTGTNGALIGPYEPGTNDATDNDDNGTTGTGGLATGGLTGGIVSGPSTLVAGTQPTTETDLGMPTGVTDLASNANSNLTIDFGVFQPASLGDYVWFDTDKDGVQDASEVGVNGVLVRLYISDGKDGIAGNADDSLPIAAITTAANGGVNGYYHFGNLTPNRVYTIALDRSNDFAAGGPLAGYTLTSKDAGNNDATDSDAVLILGIPTISATTGMPGSDTPTYDVGFNTSASLGDYIWLDANNDGVQDSSESGINGVTVHLYDSKGTALLTTTTTTQGGINGYYHFANLDINTTYVIKLDNPMDFTGSGPLANTQLSLANTTTDTDDSDATLVSGVPTISATTGGPGSDTPTYDVGVYRPVASLGDYVWNDTNKNGVQEVGESGINGVTVNLYDSTGTTLLATTTTTTNGSTTGYYHFTNLIPNMTYIVKLNNPADYATSGPLASFTLTLANQGGNDATDSDALVTSGFPTILLATTGADRSNTPTYDIGFYQALSLGNLVWNDVNNNGLKDASESGIDGIAVNLYKDTNGNGTLDAGDALVSSQTTSNGGHYLFTDLGQAIYLVQIAATNFAAGGPLAGYSSTTGQLGAATGPYEPGATSPADNDDNGTGISGGIVGGPINLAAGLQPTSEPDTALPTGVTDLATDANSNLTVDFGVFQPASVGSTVWNDLNEDGIKQPEEPGASGITVTLYDSTGTPIATTTTDANGSYMFTDLAPGTYTIGFTNLPAGATFTTANQGADDRADSDVDAATGRTESVALQPGENNPTVYAGIVVTPTAIILTRFSATWQRSAVVIQWATSAELDTFGFHLLRSSDGTQAHAISVTPTLIPAQGRGQSGANYTWIDSAVTGGQTYTYWLEETEADGTTRIYGPTTATAPGTSALYRVLLPLVQR